MGSQNIIAIWEASKFRRGMGEIRGYSGDYSEIQRWMEENCTFILTGEIPEMGIFSIQYYFEETPGVIFSHRFSDTWKAKFPIVPIYVHCYGIKLPKELTDRLAIFPEQQGAAILAGNTI